MFSSNAKTQWFGFDPESHNRARTDFSAAQLYEKWLLRYFRNHWLVCCTAEERKIWSKLNDFDSRHEIFSVFAGVEGRCIGPELQNRARRESAAAREKTMQEKGLFLCFHGSR
jgi:hypothetical protein